MKWNEIKVEADGKVVCKVTKDDKGITWTARTTAKSSVKNSGAGAARKHPEPDRIFPAACYLRFRENPDPEVNHERET
jgi:hypothetical protein